MGSPCSQPVSDKSPSQRGVLAKEADVAPEVCPLLSAHEAMTGSEEKSGTSQEAVQSKVKQTINQLKGQAPESPSLSSTHSCVFIERDDDESISKETIPQDSTESIQSGVGKGDTSEVLIEGSLTNSNDDVRVVINPDSKMKGAEITPENHRDTDGSSCSQLHKEGDGKRLKTRPCLIRLFKGQELDENYLYTNQDMVEIVTKLLENEVDTFEIEEVQTASWDRPRFFNDENDDGEDSSSAEIIHMTPLTELFSILDFFRTQTPGNSENEAEPDEVLLPRDNSVAPEVHFEASQRDVELPTVGQKGSMAGETSPEKTSGEVGNTIPVKTGDEKPQLRSLDIKSSKNFGLQATPLNSAGAFSISSELDQLVKSPEAAEKSGQLRKTFADLIKSTGAISGARKASLSGVSHTREGSKAAVLENLPEVEPKNVLDQSSISASSEAGIKVHCAV